MVSPSRRSSAVGKWAYRGTGCRSSWSLTISRGDTKCMAYRVPEAVRTAKLPDVASVIDCGLESIAVAPLVVRGAPVGPEAGSRGIAVSHRLRVACGDRT